jgi:hypothetical protein
MCGANADRNTLPNGLESGFVREIVSEIKRKNVAARRFGLELLHGNSFAS